jgi:hypothetical protein
LRAGGAKGKGIGGLLKRVVILAGLVAGGLYAKKAIDARK